MRVTNNTNQTDIVLRHVDRINNGSHKELEGNEFSVTQLLKDATAVILGIRHRNEITLDVQALGSRTRGTDQHQALEEDAKSLGYMVEMELSHHFKLADIAFKMYGKLDFYRTSDSRLIDYKTCKEATFKKNLSGEDDEWKRQLTLYVALLELINPSWYFGVDEMIIQAELFDVATVANDLKGESTDSYRTIYFTPPTKEEIAQELAKAFDKVREVIRLSKVPDKDLPICSEKYRYATSTWKIYKGTKDKHQAKAERGHAKYESYEDASIGFAKAGFTDKDHVIEAVGGESLKCKHFCDVREFCPHYKKMKEATNETVEG